MKRLVFTICLISVVLTASALDITIKPGQFAMHLREIKKSNPEALTISGSADVRDLSMMKELPASVRKIDLSGLEIQAYSFSKSGYMGKKNFPAGEIPSYSFFGSQAEDIILPSSLVTIGEGAFAHSSLKKISLPESLVKIDGYAFYDCVSLEDISFRPALSSIGKYAFSGCSAIRHASLSETKITGIPDHCFERCRELATVELPEKIYTVGSGAFSGTSVARLTLDNLREAGSFAFASMPKLKEVSFNSYSKIDEGIFFASSEISGISGLPADISDASFAGAAKIDLGSKLEATETIGMYSFTGNDSDTIRISRPLSAIGKGSFSYMKNLKAVDATGCGDDIPVLHEEAFGDTDLSAVALLVAMETADKWRAAEGWKNFDIREVKGSSGIMSPSAGNLSVSLASGLLNIKSPEPIDRVEVFAVSGIRIAGAEPHSEEFNTTISSDEKFIVVKVVRGEKVNIVKLSN